MSLPYESKQKLYFDWTHFDLGPKVVAWNYLRSMNSRHKLKPLVLTTPVSSGGGIRVLFALWLNTSQLLSYKKNPSILTFAKWPPQHAIGRLFCGENYITPLMSPATLAIYTNSKFYLVSCTCSLKWLVLYFSSLK